MSKQLLVPGHGLVSEGAAFEVDLNGTPVRLRWNTIAGKGRALCACGRLSEPLASASQRKHWHHEHKARIADSTLPQKAAPHV
jgi:hypothetical protein